MHVVKSQAEARYYPFNQVLAKNKGGNLIAISQPIHYRREPGDQWPWACGIAKLASIHLKPVYTDFIIVGYVSYDDRPGDVQTDMEKEFNDVFAPPLTYEFLITFFKKLS
jgi:hypothetical protein